MLALKVQLLEAQLELVSVEDGAEAQLELVSIEDGAETGAAGTDASAAAGPVARLRNRLAFKRKELSMLRQHAKLQKKVCYMHLCRARLTSKH